MIFHSYVSLPEGMSSVQNPIQKPGSLIGTPLLANYNPQDIG